MVKLWTKQEEGVEFLLDHPRSILADQMGAGKTVQIMETTRRSGARKILAVTQKVNAVYTTLKEAKKWYHGEWDFTPVEGSDQRARAKAWSTSDRIVTTTGAFLSDLKRGLVPTHWDSILVDEFHRTGLNNRKSNFTRALRHRLEFDAFHPYSGTPTRRGQPESLWAVLNLCNPREFRSYWAFAEHFHYIERGRWGTEFIAPKNTDELKQILARYMIRRTKQQIRPDQPPKIRQSFYVEPSDLQLRIHDELLRDMVTAVTTSGGDDVVVLASSILGVITKVRKLLVSPKLLDPTLPHGPAIDEFCDLLLELPKEERHSVFYTPFRDGVDVIAQALVEKKVMPRESVIKLMGGLSSAELGEGIERFNERQGIAVCTIKFAESFDLDSADKGFFIGYELDPDDNEQAEDRQYRITTKGLVNFQYARYHGTEDDRWYDIVNDKHQNLKKFITMSPRAFVQGK